MLEMATVKLQPRNMAVNQPIISLERCSAEANYVINSGLSSARGKAHGQAPAQVESCGVNLTRSNIELDVNAGFLLICAD